MTNKILTASVLTAILLTGCGTSSSSEDQGGTAPTPTPPPATTASGLTTAVEESIAYMGNEERLAYDIYNALYQARGEEDTVGALNKIASQAEITHIEAVRKLVQDYNIEGTELSNVVDPVADMDTEVVAMPAGEYDIPAIQELYDALYDMGKDSDEDALKVGCMVEVTDIDDLDKYLTQAETDNAPDDVISTFTTLRNDSYKHYWGFDTALIDLGISEGCCSIGEVNGVDYCQPDYPNTH